MVSQMKEQLKVNAQTALIKNLSRFPRKFQFSYPPPSSIGKQIVGVRSSDSEYMYVQWIRWKYFG